MRWLHGQPKKLTLVAYGIAAAVVCAIAISCGPRRFIDAWAHVRPEWLLVVAGGAMLAMLAYVVSYQALVRFENGPRLSLLLALRVVSLGFGPFVPGGGFDVDQRALEGIHGDRHVVSTRIFAIGALEWALLAPAACISAIVLLVGGDHRPMPSTLWPWAVAVPAGFVLGFSFVSKLGKKGLDESRSGLLGSFNRAVLGAWMLKGLARDPALGWRSVLGMASYWALDIASFYGAVRFIGLRTNLGEVVVAFATGYALTRRSMPLGGAGMCEALMTFALHWMGHPIPESLAVVVVYRLFNFVLPVVPAMLVHGGVSSFMTAAYDGRAATKAKSGTAPAGTDTPSRVQHSTQLRIDIGQHAAPSAARQASVDVLRQGSW
jgi:uncharacterized membrane protein YbhN (UPF0104 family)